jgi:hypothetical protein
MDSRHHSRKPASSQRRDFPLLEHINLHHPLIVLARLIDWNAIDQGCLFEPAALAAPPFGDRPLAGIGLCSG